MEADIDDSTRPIDHSELHQRALELQKAQRDTNSPISTVPNEVLLEIFTVLQTSCDIAEWHHVTHVCQLWRYVALGAANLWTQPPTDCYEYTLAMLERSQSASLDIMINIHTKQTATNQIFKHIGRIRSLTLDHIQVELESLRNELINPALRLHVLRVTNAFPFLHVPPSRPPYRLTLNTPNTASLQVLQVSQIDMDWQIFPIRSLTVLFLTDMLMSIPPSWIQLLQALDGMPLLIELMFELSCLQLTSPGPTLPEPLQMPHLQGMAIIGGTASAITYFLSNTVLPQLRRVFVYCRSCDSDNFEALVDAVISKADADHLNSLSLTESRLFLEQTAPRPPQWYLRSELEFPFPTMGGGIASMLCLVRCITAGAAIDLTSKIVNLGLNADLTSEQLVELFGYSFPNLKLIQLFSVSQTLVEGLVVPSTHPPNEPIPFRNLREIRLEVEGDSSSLYTPELMTALHECLKTRQEHHSPVTKVFLKCDLTPNQVSELQKLVGEVEIWEHVQLGDEMD